MRKLFAPYVFISHASDDDEASRDLYYLLTEGWPSIPCWLDKFDLAMEQGDFKGHIVKGLKNASVLVLVDTPEAARSGYVKAEKDYVAEKRIPQFPYDPQIFGCPEKSTKNIWLEIRRLVFKLRVIMRATMPFWLSSILLVLAAVLFAVGGHMGAGVLPVMAEEVQSWFSPPMEETVPEAADLYEVMDPKVAAPFHFRPDAALIYSDFDENSLNEFFQQNGLMFEYMPSGFIPEISVNDGFWKFYYPKDCLLEQVRYDCITQIHSKTPIDISTIQYFAIRIKKDNQNPYWGVSFMLSTTSGERGFDGFGWNFNNNAVPFFRNQSEMIDRDFSAFVEIDEGWHAYEILINPVNFEISYYMDGQLIDTFLPADGSIWFDGPFKFWVYADGYLDDGYPEEQNSDITVEVDELILGAFNAE